MRIDRVRLTNFRCFEDRTFDFTPKFNVLAGSNGTGKTAVLEGIAAGLGAYIRAMDQFYLRRYLDGGGRRGASPVYGVREGDVRRVIRAINQVVTAEPRLPSAVQIEGEVAGVECKWRRYAQASETPHEVAPEQFLQVAEGIPLGGTIEPQTLTKALTLLKEAAKEDGAPALPLVAYYPAGRLYRVSDAGDVTPPESRVEAGYGWCLDTNANEQEFLRWFKRTESIILQRKHSGRAAVGIEDLLESVSSALVACVPGWRNFRFDIERDELLADEVETGNIRSFRLLSDGFRSMIALVADIARRATLLNPQLGKAASSKTTGVVLIDEVDLHLHPSWQRRVVGSLRDTFPNLQFICTTHSPFIIQQLREGELVKLDGELEADYSEKPIDDIAEGVMGVHWPQMSSRKQAMLDAARLYMAALKEGPQNGNVDALRKRLDELKAPFSDDPAFVAVLELERAGQGLPGPEDRGPPRRKKARKKKSKKVGRGRQGR